MKTYEEIANAYKMDDVMKARFLKYMRTRWGDYETEKRHCIVGYAQEWAGRFVSGVEFGCSDSEGRAILQMMEDSHG